MKIQAVLIDGFKNLSDVKITFDNITALVALNHFAKSNVLSGIDFGLIFIKASVEDKLEMMANANFIPLNQSMQGRNTHNLSTEQKHLPYIRELKQGGALHG